MICVLWDKKNKKWVTIDDINYMHLEADKKHFILNNTRYSYETYTVVNVYGTVKHSTLKEACKNEL